MKNITINAMIPARIGSTRFAKKNLALLNGKPMIYYSIDASKRSKVFNKIILNADHDIFEKIAAENEIDFYLRPKFLGGSEIKSDDVVADFLENFDSDILVWENPIAPLQTVHDIRACVSFFLENDFDCLYTVKSEQVQCVYENKPINFDILKKFEQTQKLKPVYPFVPFLMMWKTSSFKESYNKNGHGFFCGKVGYFPVSKRSSIIIKYEEDFRLAQNILQSEDIINEEIKYYDNN